MNKFDLNTKEGIRDIIKNNMPALAELYFGIILCKSGVPLIDETTKKRILEAFEKVLPKFQLDTPDIQMETTADIVKAVCEGKITIDEAQKLMDILTSKANIDMSNKLMEGEYECSQSDIS